MPILYITMRAGLIYKSIINKVRNMLKQNMLKLGTDESGKGDYFGYLVVAGVIVDENKELLLKALRVRDSKLLSEKQIFFLSAKIKKLCKYNIVKISPEKYNELYDKMKNLNKLLAWAHARVIENLLEKYNVDVVISDQFGDKKFLEHALMKKGKKVKLIQKIRAESEISVAAASILARAEFLLTLRKLSKQYFNNPNYLEKGADVENLAKKIVEKHGLQILDKIAKRHFRITKKILKS